MPPSMSLQETVLLCLKVGARIQLTQNIWVKHGLINGSMGSVVDIVWSANADVVKELPSALMVRFDAYTGPVLFDDGDGKPAVLIFPVRRDFGPIDWIPDEDRGAVTLGEWRCCVHC
jgi:hypothetical protein